MPTAEELNQRFQAAKDSGGQGIKFDTTTGGIVRAVIATAEAESEVYLQGAHVATWIPKGQRPVLFLSQKSLFAPGKAIRGGVPIIFPWFGARGLGARAGARGEGKPAPQHGFARSMDWTLEDAKLDGGKAAMVFSLSPNDKTREFGFDGFEVRFHVSIGAALEMVLETTNTSQSPLTYEEALHTYLAISDIANASVTGLAGTTSIDKTDGMKRKPTGDAPLKLTKETDQVHLNTQATCVVEDTAWKRSIVVEKSGSNSTVIWNPWSEKTAGMADMGPEEWRGMICVETANAAENAVTLAPGDSHTMKAVILVKPGD